MHLRPYDRRKREVGKSNVKKDTKRRWITPDISLSYGVGSDCGRPKRTNNQDGKEWAGAGGKDELRTTKMFFGTRSSPDKGIDIFFSIHLEG